MTKPKEPEARWLSEDYPVAVRPMNRKRTGFTLADSQGYKRLKMLADSKHNLLLDIQEKEDKIAIIDAEMRTLYHAAVREYQTGILDPVVPALAGGS